MKKGICPNHDQHNVANSKKVQKCAEGHAFNCRYCLAPLEPYTEQESPFAMAIRFFKELNPSIYRHSGLGFATFFLLISFFWIVHKFYPKVTVTKAAITTKIAPESISPPKPDTIVVVPEVIIEMEPVPKDAPPKELPQVQHLDRVRPQTSAERIIRRTTLTPYIMQGGQKMELDIDGLKNRGNIDEMANSQISVNFGLSKDAFPYSNDTVEFTLKNSKGGIAYGPKQIAVIDGTETIIIPAGVIASSSNELYTATLYYQQEELGRCQFRVTK